MSAVAAKRPADSPSAIQQVYNALEILGDRQIPSDPKFKTIQKAAVLGVKFVFYNEQRVAVREGELDDLERANKRLKWELGDQNGTAKDLKASNQKLVPER